MISTQTRYEHIVLDEGGVPRIEGTRLKAIDLIAAQRANNWTPDELHEQHPELTLGQIYSALAYYWDHQDELDAAIVSRQNMVEHMKEQARPSRLIERLRQSRDD